VNGSKEASKNFFFEKKKQKTFINLGHRRFQRHGLEEQKFFARFFLKKRCLLSSHAWA
jgi:hypothetical protein